MKTSDARIALRNRITLGLKSLSTPTLAQMYEYAVDLVGSYSPESNSAEFDLMRISHCVRELMNRLPDYLDKGDSFCSNKLGSELEKRQELNNVLLTECDESTFFVKKGSVVAVIPANVAKTVEQYRKAVKAGNANSNNKIFLATIGRIEDNPVYIPWKEAHNFFMGYVHLSKTITKLPSQDKVSTEFLCFENSLSSRLGYFFDSKKMLKGILETTNTQADDGQYLIPSDENLKTALSLVGNSGLRFIFFSELSNPMWLQALLRNKVFTPKNITLNDMNYYPDWPEAIYLKRIVDLDSNGVTDAIIEASHSRSPVIRCEAIKISVKLPIDCVVKFADYVVDWAESGFCAEGYFWIASEVENLICRLMTSDMKKARSVGKRLFVACFSPRADGTNFYRIHSLIPEYKYSKCMEQLTNVIELMTPRLRRELFCSFSEGILYQTANGEKSSYRITSVEDSCKNHSQSVPDEVIYQMVHSLRVCFDDDPDEAICWVRKKSSNPLIVRCAMFVEHAILQKRVESHSVDTSVVKHVRELLLSDLITESEFDSEFYPLFLLAQNLNVVNPGEIDECVLQGSLQKLAQYQTNCPELAEADLKIRVRHWQHRALCLIGRDSLGVKGKETLDELSKEFSETNYSVRHIFSTETITVPNSPIDSSLMLEMGTERLINHLVEWHPSETDKRELVTYQGQAEQLSQALERCPDLFSGYGKKLGMLHIAYQREIMNGMSIAASKGKAIPIDDSLEMIVNASQKSEAVSWENKGDFLGDDCNYLNLRREAAQFANRLIEGYGEQLTNNQANLLLNALLKFADSDEPNAQYEEKYGGDNMDPVTLALNTIRPIALVGIAKWLGTFQDGNRKASALSVIERYLPSRSESVADAAAIGKSIPYIMNVEPSWIQKNYVDLFGKSGANKYQQIVLTTVLAIYYPTFHLFKILSPAMISSLENGPEYYVLGFRGLHEDCLSLIGHWLYVGYVSGFLDDENLVLDTWRKIADANHMGYVLGKLCGMVSSDGSLSKDVINRVGLLWDYHSKFLVNHSSGSALKGIESLIISGFYPVNWWGSRVLRELKANPHEISIYVIGEKLIELSTYDPELAVNVLCEIAKNDAHPFSPEYEDIGIQLISKAKMANGGHLSMDAIHCMDMLGQIGCIHLDEQLK